MYRQGDILLIPVATLPHDARPHGSRVLAEGEATGHKHRVEGGEVLRDRNGTLYLRLAADTRLVHEEHHPITLPEGSYVVRRQREFDPELDALGRWRSVAD